MMTQINPDIDILERVSRSDEEALSILMGKYMGCVFSLILRITGNHEDAEELTQDVFVKVFLNSNKFKNKSSVSTWIYSIAYNTAVSYTRRRKYDFIEIDEHKIGDVDEDVMENTLRRQAEEGRLDILEKALILLCPDDRVIVELFYLHDRSVGDIADIVGCNLSAAKVKLHRARKKLYVLMNG